ncbi:MAG: OpgC domain-containing protein [Paracoccaceae bacterium]
MSDPAPALRAPAPKKPRDPRLDFFRGIAMFIILLAHTPGNPWTLWIPARFGFSDATEIFVFCSGMASALAFGGAFGSHGFGIGTGRVAYRVWQVYWSHVGLVIAVIALLTVAEAQGWGEPEKDYLRTLPIVPFFEDTGAALVGLLTLTWVPNYFDILPMYLVILAMIPAVMAAHRAGGTAGAAGLVAALWLAAQFGLTDLPSRPWAPEIPWFFNPFGWQLVFFTGFAFGMGWIAPPPVRRRLVRLAAEVVLLTIPFAWFRIHGGQYLPDGWWLQDGIEAVRAATRDLWRKTEQGLLRWAHFLALAYLAWVWAGKGGRRLTEGMAPWGPPSRLWLRGAAAVAVLTAPYAYVNLIPAVSPTLDAGLTWALGEGARSLLGFDLFVPSARIQLLGILHLAALGVLAWAALGPGGRDWAARRVLPSMQPVIRKVGQQSLAVFLVSMGLAQAMGITLDAIGRNMSTVAAVNLAGFAGLVATAYGVGWFRSQPWRRRPAPRDAAGAALAAPGE